MKEPFPETLPDPWGTIKRVLWFAALLCLLVSAAWFLAGSARALWTYAAGRPSRAAPLPNPVQDIVDARDAAQYDSALQLAADGLKSHPDIPQIGNCRISFNAISARPSFCTAEGPADRLGRLRDG